MHLRVLYIPSSNTFIGLINVYFKYIFKSSPHIGLLHASKAFVMRATTPQV